MNPAPPILAATLRTLAASVLLALGALLFAIAWLIVADRTAGRAGAMAPLSAMIVIALLRATGTQSGWPRARLAALVTCGYLAAGEWLVSSLPIAAQAGIPPWKAVQEMGADFGWTLIHLGNTPLDWLWIGIAIALALRFGR
jgi:hypothetical protein